MNQVSVFESDENLSYGIFNIINLNLVSSYISKYV